MPSFPEHHQLPEPTQTQVYHVGDAIQPSHPLLSSSPPGFGYAQINFQASLVVQTVKNLPAMHKTRDPSLGQEDPLEKGMATHSSILAWTILWTEKPGGL